MFGKLLIANRGEIACRVITTAHRLGIETVAVYSDADRNARHVAMAGESYAIGPAPPAESYLRSDRIIDVARQSGADAIHPGYGFLSENTAFASACAEAGLIFVGPPPAAISAMGEKDVAKSLMEKAGVPVVPGYHGKSQSPKKLLDEAKKIGFPVLIKAAAGGGGKGMRRVDSPAAFAEALESARRESKSAFGSSTVLIEKFVEHARHVEVQIFADSHGSAVHLFERDCSMQRRHQKVIEEAPAPNIDAKIRERLGNAAVAAAQAIDYVGAGTVEFLLDASDSTSASAFYFMEMNTRLQVEHPVTEAITGLDLVEWQCRVAAGERLPKRQDDLEISGHAIEARVYAEDPARGFLPSIGRLQRLEFPRAEQGVRVDSGVRQGDTVTVYYDPMIAKLIAHGADRSTALSALRGALSRTAVLGVRTNIGFLSRLLELPDFVSGAVDTGLLERQVETLLAPAARHRLLAMALVFVMYGAPPAPNPTRGDRYSPWHRPNGWRLSGAVRSQVTLTIDSEIVGFVVIHAGVAGMTVEIEAEGEVSIDDIEVGEGAVTARIDGMRAVATVFRRADEIDLSVDGDTLKIMLGGDLTEAEQSGGSTADRVVAPLPGKVAAVPVAKGDSVTKGTVLVVVEAMKMEHALVASHAGTVDEIHCAQGQMVDEGATLVTLSA